MKVNRYEIYQGKGGWNWRLVAEENGEILASGESYRNRTDVAAVIDRISDGATQRKVVELDKRVDRSRPFRLEKWLSGYGGYGFYDGHWSWIGNYSTLAAAKIEAATDYHKTKRFRVVDTKTREVIEEWIK